MPGISSMDIVMYIQYISTIVLYSREEISRCFRKQYQRSNSDIFRNNSEHARGVSMIVEMGGGELMLSNKTIFH